MLPPEPQHQRDEVRGDDPKDEVQDPPEVCHQGTGGSDKETGSPGII